MKNKIKLIENVAEDLEGFLSDCCICPRACHVNRKDGKKGYCKAGVCLVVYTAFLHRGEEPAISGDTGSGTIFFSGCNLACVYCQNYKFSHSIEGSAMTPAQVCDLMLKLQEEGASNINLVTPTHFLPQILNALTMAFPKGLNIPIVYNTSGYEKKDIIRKLDGIVDVYLTDFRYFYDATGAKYSNAKDYPFHAKESISEMYRQKSKPVFKDELLKEGLVIRHLILPGHIEESKQVLSWIKQNIPGAFLSLMFQYQPYHKANKYPVLNRTVSKEEYIEVNKFLKELDLDGWVQDLIPEEKLAGVHFNETTTFQAGRRRKGV
ncbi:MAG: radical SAM protein [Candidatus Omnitrophota bacterium]|jgi:putative pyruvate formate lyase activating enzyme